MCNTSIASLSLMNFVSSCSFQAIYHHFLYNQHCFQSKATFNRKVKDLISYRILNFLLHAGLLWHLQYLVIMPNISHTCQKFSPEIHMFAGLNQPTTGECLDVLRSIGLPQHCSMFESNQVDGPMLEALIHPHLGQQIMLSLGVNDTSDCHGGGL